MKNIITLFFLALTTFCAAQTNQVKTPGVSYSAGAPNWVPVVKTASELAIDTVSKRIYLWNRNTATWDIQGRGVDQTSGSTPPAYTPSQTDSYLALNNANPPELYAWTGSAWAKVGGTVQTIDTFSVSGSIVSLSLSGDAQPAKTITLPASGITALTGDVTATGPGSVAATIANGAVTDAKITSVDPSKLLQDGATTGQVLTWDGSAWNPATPSGGGWSLTGNAATAGSSFLGTTNNASLRFRTNNVQRMIVDSLGRIGIGVAPTTTKFHVLGNSSATSTYTAEFHNSTGTNNALRIRDDGRVIAASGYFTGDAASLAGLFPNSSYGNRGVILRGNLNTSETGDDIVMENGQGHAANTSGIRNLFFTSRGFAPTSGTGEFRAFALAPVINQTGAANGPSIGFLAVPTLTSAFSWRSFEYRNSSGFGIYGSGTAPNYINGNIGVRTTSATDNVDINGSNGYTQLRLRTTYTPTSSADVLGNTGDVSWDADYIYIKTAAGWKRSALTTF